MQVVCFRGSSTVYSNQHYITASYCIHAVTREPTSLSATSKSNNTHVNITVTWKSPQRYAPRTPLRGYVLYYQPNGGAVNSVNVSKIEKYLLEGLQRGVTYNISIVAVSETLPSPLVGPITVIPGSYISGTVQYTPSKLAYYEDIQL